MKIWQNNGTWDAVHDTLRDKLRTTASRNPQLTAVIIDAPRRWVVGRTFGWLGRYRRLSKDYEAKPEATEMLIKIAMIQLIVRRLTEGC
jgi:transposase